MCGIVGIEFSEHANKQDIKDWIKKSLIISSRRGRDCSGVSFLVKKEDHFNLATFRSENPIEITFKDESFNNFIDKVYKQKDSKIIAIIGHTRIATNADSSNYNNQPLVSSNKKSALVFNGIICNANEIIKKSKIKKNSLNDGTALWSLDNSKKFSKKIEGYFAYIKINKSKNIKMSYMTNNGSLYKSIKPNFQINKIFLSEASFFKKMGINSFEKVKLNKEFSFNLTNQKKILLNSEINYIKSKNLKFLKVFEIKKNSISKNLKKQINKRLNFVSKKIIRCTNCILPNTHPFIYFNHKGTCNFCIGHNRNILKPKKKFIDALFNVKKKYGDNQILSSLSGGRDSSYALHVLVKKLKIKPITYTYDWGLSTDLGRRNVSRMCGELNVENIIINANIRTKRENIKKNINAWLKKPHLGVVPLFMAGDKQFISSANVIKKELDIKLEIFATNKFEITQFKEEFTGFKMWDEKIKNDPTKMKIISQFHMLYFYGKQFLLNPLYLNSSMVDSFKGFVNYYHSGVNELHIYDYYDWNEDKINHTLTNNYGWETAIDTKNTWRIGDGTTPFYNFIYLLFAGFTENDVFRSHLIRENKLERSEALKLIKEENQPRYPTLEWYCKLFDFNFEDVLKKIVKSSWNYNFIDFSYK